MATDISPGDVVVDEHGVRMTVDKVDGEVAFCVWFDPDNSLHRLWIDCDDLTVVA